MSALILDAMPTVRRVGAGRKPTIVKDAPEILEAKGKFVVLGPWKVSTANNRANKLKEFPVENGAIDAVTRHAYTAPDGDEVVAPDGENFVIAAFVATPKPPRQRRQRPAAVAPEADAS